MGIEQRFFKAKEYDCKNLLTKQRCNFNKKLFFMNQKGLSINIETHRNLEEIFLERKFIRGLQS